MRPDLIPVESIVEMSGFQQLPPGWQEIPDPSTGKKFFYHAGTGKRQWDFPTSATANVPTELPPGWQKHYDPNTGRAFYLNPIGQPQVSVPSTRHRPRPRHRQRR